MTVTLGRFKVIDAEHNLYTLRVSEAVEANEMALYDLVNAQTRKFAELRRDIPEDFRFCVGRESKTSEDGVFVDHFEYWAPNHAIRDAETGLALQ